ncbi:DUF58 domain-containing protein [Allorhodopirellula heiligendammensis]|uniref:Uncharacterized protein n=1 Tax=Allorhodopirellula heiligendammensis TaxID=2714739 RepID=A0A5C6C2K4_9BACT|nr:DUF58 domain-containing protein [Allorhodopirellula heiligendammensis]TWU17079.1 hypothetical protein Poly21_42890 [Allorhodopirellula heiligendammensis]
MAVVHAAPVDSSRLSRIMTTDFCPWANRFVYWLKEPVGWFALATAVSTAIGLYFSPIGWTLAASLAAIMVTGMAWPWVAVHVTQCALRPEADAVYEDVPCQMVLSVRNRVPIPVWGLAIEGYLDREPNGDARPTVGLACVPPLCTADYKVNVTPSLRGHYPVSEPQVACSFPFGIWTARRSLKEIKSLTVWPKLFPIHGVLPIVGHTVAEQGDGSRGGRNGDFVGVRAFRRGDSSKHVNWIASARSDSLIVTERGAPQSVALDVFIDTSSSGTHEFLGRESLARRIRVAASVLSSLHQSRIATRVRIGDRRLAYQHDVRGRRYMLDALASVPLDGEPCELNQRVLSRASVTISGASCGSVFVCIANPLGGRRAGGATREVAIGPHADLAAAIAVLWKEVRDADVAA